MFRSMVRSILSLANRNACFVLCDVRPIGVKVSFFISHTRLEHASRLLEWVLGSREVEPHPVLDTCPPFGLS